MLTKTICQQCYENHGKKWEPVDNDLWCDENIRHFVVCPAVVDVKNFGNFWERLRASDKAPPDHCPYHLEHILEENEERSNGK